MSLDLQQVSIERDGQPLFAPISLSVAAGVVVGVMGASGCGKSSLIAYIAGVLSPELRGQGSVQCQGQEITLLSAEKRRVGLLFQDNLLFPHLSVIENLLFAVPADHDRAVRRALAMQSLSDAGLADFSTSDPMSLSGGQRARVAMQRVLLSQPQALLLDEPFNKLDQQLRGQFRDYVFARIAAAQIPCLMVSHDPADIQHDMVQQVIHLHPRQNLRQDTSFL